MEETSPRLFYWILLRNEGRACLTAGWMSPHRVAEITVRKILFCILADRLVEFHFLVRDTTFPHIFSLRRGSSYSIPFLQFMVLFGVECVFLVRVTQVDFSFFREIR